jgi:hypothetical protein
VLEDRPVKGRGAVSNRSGRYERHQRIEVDDGWSRPQDPERDRPYPEDEADWAQRPRTTVTADASRSVIARNQSPDVPFEQSINPYRGCGCSPSRMPPRC